MEQKDFFQRIYECSPGVFIVICSDSKEGLLEKSFSKEDPQKSFRNLYRANKVIYIYNLSKNYMLDIDADVWKSKKMIDIGIALENRVRYVQIGSIFYFIGDVEDCNGAIRSSKIFTRYRSGGVK